MSDIELYLKAIQKDMQILNHNLEKIYQEMKKRNEIFERATNFVIKEME